MSTTNDNRAVACIRFGRLWRWIGSHILKCDCSKCEWNKTQVQRLHEVVAMAQADCMRLANYYQSELQRIQIEHESKQIEHESKPNDQAVQPRERK